MVKGLRRRARVCGGTYIAQPHCHHLRANTSTCTFLHQALYSLSMLFTALLVNLYSCALYCLEPENLPSDIIEATCRPHFTFSGDGSISGIHPLRWPIMSPGPIMSRLPRSPLRGLCQSGILIDRQRGEVVTPECFDSRASYQQTRGWEVDGFDFLSPWIESTMYKTVRNPFFFVARKKLDKLL